MKKIQWIPKPETHEEEKQSLDGQWHATFNFGTENPKHRVWLWHVNAAVGAFGETEEEAFIQFLVELKAQIDKLKKIQNELIHQGGDL